MIDKWTAKRSHKKHGKSAVEYNPGMAVVGTEITDPESSSLVVVFPPWHGIEHLAPIIKRRMRKNGLALLMYTLHNEILSADCMSVIGSFESIQATAIDDIRRLDAANKYDDIHLVGFSLGNVALAMTAAGLERNFRTTCVVGSSNLARSTWEGIRTQHLREEFEAQGFTKDRLDEAWTSLAPGNNAVNFKDNKVHLVISKSDRTLPYEHQEDLAVKLREAGADLTIDRTGYGHVMSVIKYAFVGEL